jgi:hypothetical protein
MNEAARRIIAVFLGFGLFSIVTLFAWVFFGSSPSYPFLLLMLSHAITAAVLGYSWPQMAWRVGLWMFLPWPLFLLVGFFLTGEYLITREANRKDVFVVLLFCFSMLPVGCIGGWLGGIAKRQFGNKTPVSPVSSSSA